IEKLVNEYQTSIPLKVMGISLGIGAIVAGGFYFGVGVLLFGIAYYFALSAFEENELPSWTAMPPAYYRDGLVIGLAGALGFLGLSRALKAITAAWAVAHRSAGAAFGGHFDSLLPGPQVLANAIFNGFLLAAVVSLAGAFVAARVRRVP